MKMEEFFAIREALAADKELMRLASLVGTDAKDPEVKLADYIAETCRQLFATHYKAREAGHDLILKKYKKLVAAIFAVRFYLDQPYPDDRRWTPYTRFVGPRLKMLEAAITKGEDIGDLEGMARVHQEGGSKGPQS